MMEYNGLAAPCSDRECAYRDGCRHAHPHFFSRDCRTAWEGCREEFKCRRLPDTPERRKQEDRIISLLNKMGCRPEFGVTGKMDVILLFTLKCCCSRPVGKRLPEFFT